MKTLKDAIDYTSEVMSHKMRKMDKMFRETSWEDINEYLYKEGDDTRISSSTSRLSSWYLWRFLDEFLNNQSLDYHLLSKSTFYGILSNKWEYLLGSIYKPYDDCLQFKYTSAHLSQLLFLNYDEEAVNYCELIKKMLNGKQSPSFSDYPKYPWFILDLYLRSKGEKISDKWNYPKKMGIYGEVLKYWDSEDNGLIDGLIGKLCDHHIIESDEYAQTTPPEDDGILNPEGEPREFLEFSSADYFIFPVEILAWLRLRKNKGLYIGNNVHPLLQLEINHLPNEKMKMPIRDELINECINKLQKDFPAIKIEI